MTLDTLRRAATLMRERALAASSPPWVAFRAHDRAPHDGGDWIGVTRDLAVDYDPDVFSSQRCSVPDAEHIASWHPATALAVADLLDLVADHGDFLNLNHSALAVANAYLGDTP